MEYKVNKEKLLEKFRQEVARTASREYTGDGTSLYDSVWPTSQDDDIIAGLMHDAVTNVMIRLRLAFPLPSGEDGFVLELPDLDENMESSAKDFLDRYIVLETCRSWTSKVSENLSAKYEDEAGKAMDRVIKIVYTRKTISR